MYHFFYYSNNIILFDELQYIFLTFYINIALMPKRMTYIMGNDKKKKEAHRLWLPFYGLYQFSRLHFEECRPAMPLSSHRQSRPVFP